MLWQCHILATAPSRVWLSCGEISLSPEATDWAGLVGVRC